MTLTVVIASMMFAYPALEIQRIDYNEKGLLQGITRAKLEEFYKRDEALLDKLRASSDAERRSKLEKVIEATAPLRSTLEQYSQSNRELRLFTTRARQLMEGKSNLASDARMESLRKHFSDNEVMIKRTAAQALSANPDVVKKVKSLHHDNRNQSGLAFTKSRLAQATISDRVPRTIERKPYPDAVFGPQYLIQSARYHASNFSSGDASASINQRNAQVNLSAHAIAPFGSYTALGTVGVMIQKPQNAKRMRASLQFQYDFSGSVFIVGGLGELYFDVEFAVTSLQNGTKLRGTGSDLETHDISGIQYFEMEVVYDSIAGFHDVRERKNGVLSVEYELPARTEMFMLYVRPVLTSIVMLTAESRGQVLFTPTEILIEFLN